MYDDMPQGLYDKSVARSPKKKKIYLASPYTNNIKSKEANNFEKACEVAARIMKDGRYVVFSPIAHSHPIALKGSLPTEWEFWETFDESFVEWCDEIWVLTLKGWVRSKGVKREIEIAKRLGKELRYITYYEFVGEREP